MCTAPGKARWAPELRARVAAVLLPDGTNLRDQHAAVRAAAAGARAVVHGVVAL